MSAMMLITGFNSLTTTMAASNAMLVIRTALLGESTAAQILDANATNASKIAKMLGISVEQAELLIKKKNTGVTWQEAAAKLGLTTADNSSTAAKWA
jgi:hypothetical protein